LLVEEGERIVKRKVDRNTDMDLMWDFKYIESGMNIKTIKEVEL